jgi:hypothetical protein
MQTYNAKTDVRLCKSDKGEAFCDRDYLLFFWDRSKYLSNRFIRLSV